jgi:hypothetical protein
VQDFREHSDGDVFPERLQNLTKGEAAHIITRLKHGAQVSGFRTLAGISMTLSPKSVDTSRNLWLIASLR